jgi:RNA polymerase sigma factor (sigma-70 family)
MLRRRRRARVRLGRPGEVLQDVEASLSGTAVGAQENEAFGPEDRERVLAALDCLSKDQRTAVVLTKRQGKSVAEAANILGTTAGAVKLRAHRAYGRLRDRLREQDDGASGHTTGRGPTAFAA